MSFITLIKLTDTIWISLFVICKQVLRIWMVDYFTLPSHYLRPDSAVVGSYCSKRDEAQLSLINRAMHLRGWPPKTCPSPTVLSCRIWYQRMEIRRKKWTFAFRLWRSLKVIGTDAYRSGIYDFILVIHSNHGPILSHFQNIPRYCPKIVNFSYPMYLMPR